VGEAQPGGGGQIKGKGGHKGIIYYQISISETEKEKTKNRKKGGTETKEESVSRGGASVRRDRKDGTRSSTERERRGKIKRQAKNDLYHRGVPGQALKKAEGRLEKELRPGPKGRAG